MMKRYAIIPSGPEHDEFSTGTIHFADCRPSVGWYRNEAFLFFAWYQGEEIRGYPVEALAELIADSPFQKSKAA